MSAILAHWRKLNRNDFINFNREAYDETSTSFLTIKRTKINIVTAKAKHYYQALIENNIEKPKALRSWATVGIDEETFLESMVFARSSSKEPKLLSTHYKIIHNIWPTNVKLFDWKLKNTDECFFCKEKDTIIHTLMECFHTKIFLTEVSKFLGRHQTFIHQCRSKISYSG